jgi:hypothetical protein
MTIQELMDRIAGDDLEWADTDSAMLREMADYEVRIATLTGIGKDGRTFICRLPVEKLRSKK